MIYNHAVGSDYFWLFADSVALFMSRADLRALIANIISKFEDLFKWCISNKLTINAKKTYFVLFHTINKPINQHFNEIKNEFMTIVRLKSFRYQRLILDETLNWNDHMNEFCKSFWYIQPYQIQNHPRSSATVVLCFHLFEGQIWN